MVIELQPTMIQPTVITTESNQASGNTPKINISVCVCACVVLFILFAWIIIFKGIDFHEL